MNIEDVQTELVNYIKQCDQICEITKTAHRNNKSLSGNNPYGNRFHEAVMSLVTSENKLVKALGSVCEDGEQDRFLTLSEIIKSPTIKATQKSTASKEITMAWRSDYLHRLEGLSADPIPTTEQILPMAVVNKTRGYIEKVVLQANGCYEHGWYDACSVMIRRIIETLIIEVYEADGRPQDIKDNNGEFRMLRDLVAIILADASFNLGRDVKRSLPELKELGDRSAHKRRYNATKGDIDKILSGLRVTVEELLHLAKMK